MEREAFEEEHFIRLPVSYAVLNDSRMLNWDLIGMVLVTCRKAKQIASTALRGPSCPRLTTSMILVT